MSNGVPDSSPGADKHALLFDGPGWSASYGDAYLEAYPDYVEEKAAQNAKIRALLGLLNEMGLAPPPSSRLLILGTGHGPHEAVLAAAGYAVIGLDLNLEALRRARRSCRPGVSHLLADITRPLPLRDASCAAVLSLGSSFGFEEDATNRRVFVGAAAALAPRGVFVLDYVNGAAARQGVPVLVTPLPAGKVRYEEQVDVAGGSASLKRVTVRRGEQTLATFYHYMRYYSLDECRAMLEAAGLCVLGAFGDLDGRPFVPDSSGQIVIVARQA